MKTNPKKKKQQKRNTRNSKILQATMVTLGALKEESPALQEMGINEIQVHLLDEDGDGVVLCLEYDETTGELSKTFSTMDEYYEEGGVDGGDGIGEDEIEIEVELENGGIESFIEETISEEYDEVLSEVFHNSESKPPLLN